LRRLELPELLDRPKLKVKVACEKGGHMTTYTFIFGILPQPK